MSANDTRRDDPVLKVRNLQIHFTTYRGISRAVDAIDLDIYRGETLGIVGESGCGKSVTALSIMRLLPVPPARVAGGTLTFFPDDDTVAAAMGTDLLQLPDREMADLRGNQLSMIFQEPMTSLNPVFTIGHQLREVLTRHRGLKGREAELETVRLLNKVRLPDVARRVRDYPHQLSGGQRQRVMIAMALACDPVLLLADEPTTALDVTVQAQILKLMEELKAERNSAIVLISHDLGVIAEVADRICVMYAGEKAEEQPVAGLFANPRHPYTQGLLRSIPARQARRQKLHVIRGTVPRATDWPQGCRFAPRCDFAYGLCRRAHPPLAACDDGALVRCFLYEECVARWEEEAKAWRGTEEEKERRAQLAAAQS